MILKMFLAAMRGLYAAFSGVDAITVLQVAFDPMKAPMASA